MSEPKAVAGTIDEVIQGLFHYKVHDERIKTRSDAFVLLDQGRLVLVDPLPFEPAALARLGGVSAIVLGTASHQRSAWRLRRETKARVYAPAEARGLEEKADVSFREGDALPGGLMAVHAPGPASAHHALHLDRGPGVLLCTDLLVNLGKGPQFLSDDYQEDEAQGRESGRRLLELKFDLLGFGHGEPILRGGRAALEKLVGAGGA